MINPDKVDYRHYWLASTPDLSAKRLCIPNLHFQLLLQLYMTVVVSQFNRKPDISNTLVHETCYSSSTSAPITNGNNTGQVSIALRPEFVQVGNAVVGRTVGAVHVSVTVHVFFTV